MAGRDDRGAGVTRVPRELTGRERAALDLLLSAEFAGVHELRQQASSAKADGRAMIIDLVVDDAAPLATVLSRTPVQAVVDVRCARHSLARGVHVRPLPGPPRR
jgi:hypothetical protein